MQQFCLLWGCFITSVYFSSCRFKHFSNTFLILRTPGGPIVAKGFLFVLLLFVRSVPVTLGSWGALWLNCLAVIYGENLMLRLWKISKISEWKCSIYAKIFHSILRFTPEIQKFKFSIKTLIGAQFFKFSMKTLIVVYHLNSIEKSFYCWNFKWKLQFIGQNLQ